MEYRSQPHRPSASYHSSSNSFHPYNHPPRHQQFQPQPQYGQRDLQILSEEVRKLTTRVDTMQTSFARDIHELKKCVGGITADFSDGRQMLDERLNELSTRYKRSEVQLRGLTTAAKEATDRIGRRFKEQDWKIDHIVEMHRKRAGSALPVSLYVSEEEMISRVRHWREDVRMALPGEVIVMGYGESETVFPPLEPVLDESTSDVLEDTAIVDVFQGDVFEDMDEITVHHDARCVRPSLKDAVAAVAVKLIEQCGPSQECSIDWVLETILRNNLVTKVGGKKPEWSVFTECVHTTKTWIKVDGMERTLRPSPAGVRAFLRQRYVDCENCGNSTQKSTLKKGQCAHCRSAAR